MKRHITILVMMFLMAICLVGCGGKTGSSSYSIEYRVTGSAHTVSVTYTNEGGSTSQLDSVSLPWSYVFTANSGDFVAIIAQNNADSGSVIVTILKDGSEWKTSTSSGGYVIAMADAMLP